MTDEALKALNASQIDLYYLYAIRYLHEHTHMLVHKISTHADNTGLPAKNDMFYFFFLQAQRVQMFYIQYWTAK